MPVVPDFASIRPLWPTLTDWTKDMHVDGRATDATGRRYAFREQVHDGMRTGARDPLRASSRPDPAESAGAGTYASWEVSAGVAKSGGDGVDRNEQGASQLRFLRTGPVPSEQLDLEVVDRPKIIGADREGPLK